MNDNSPVILVFLALLIIGGVVVELGLVSGGVYDVIRTIVLIVIVLAVLCVIGIVAAIVWSSKHSDANTSNKKDGKGPSVHSSSANEAAGTRYAKGRGRYVPPVEKIDILDQKEVIGAEIDDKALASQTEAVTEELRQAAEYLEND